MHDFKDYTFLIPFKNDNIDRVINLNIILRYINNFFETSVCIVEQIDDHNHKTDINTLEFNNINIKHLVLNDKTNNERFSGIHKTKLYNIGISNIETNNIICFDCDIIIPINQMIISRDNMNNGCDYIFPFSQGYIEIIKSPDEYRKNLLNTYDFNKYNDYVFSRQKIVDSTPERKGVYKPPGLVRGNPPGGCVFIKKTVYVDIGMENENFYGYGPEDQERKYRLEKFNYNTKIIPGYLYHLEHNISHNRTSPIIYKKLFENLKHFDINQLKLYYKELNYKQIYGII